MLQAARDAHARRFDERFFRDPCVVKRTDLLRDV
jgi:hypothetical protein